jgi:transposase-like protein
MRRTYRRWTAAEKRAAVEPMAVCGHGKLAKELGISKRQLYTWRSWVQRLERAARAETRPDNENSPAIGIQFVDRKLVGREETVEVKRERNQSDREFLALIEEHCAIIPAEELAFIEASQRERLKKGFGLYGVEAMLLGSKTDALLWTDDLVQAQMAAIEFGTKRVWTQLVITLLAESSLLSPKERDVAAAKLVYMGYTYTSYDVASIIEAIELSDGKPWDGPLKSFVQQFGAGDANLAVQFPILVGFIRQLCRESVLAEMRCTVITAFLDPLWRTSLLDELSSICERPRLEYLI